MPLSVRISRRTLALAIAVAGLALALSALQVFIKDVEHILLPVLMILMYLTPILYPLSLVPEGLRPWVAANPFGYLVDRLRDALLDGRLALHWGDAVAVVVALALFAGGRWIFLRLSPHFGCRNTAISGSTRLISARMSATSRRMSHCARTQRRRSQICSISAKLTIT